MPPASSPRRRAFCPGGAIEIRIDSSTTLKEAVVGALARRRRRLLAGRPLVGTGHRRPWAAAGAVGRALRARPGARPGRRVAAVLRRLPGRVRPARLLDGHPRRRLGHLRLRVHGRRTRSPASASDAIDTAAEYGSAGALESVVLMDDLGKYPADPNARAQRREHEPLARRPRERPPLGCDAALPRREREGVRRVARPPARPLELLLRLGRLRARGQRHRGLRRQASAPPTPCGATVRSTSTRWASSPPSEVPASFYVESPSGASQTRESAPRTGVSFTGTRRNVTIEDVVAAMGRARARRPRGRRGCTGRRGSTSWAAAVRPTPPRSPSSRRSGARSRATSSRRRAAA